MEHTVPYSQSRPRLEILDKQFIYPPDQPTGKISHCSNHIHFNGVHVAAWFSGSGEGEPDTGIWLAMQQKDGTFCKPRCVACGEEAHWNPVLLVGADGKLQLLYKEGNLIRTWRTMRRISDDGGYTWGEPTELVPGDCGGRGPVRCKTITLADGTIAAGASIEEGIWSAFCDRSPDGGTTWLRGEPIMIDVEYHGNRTTQESTIAVAEQSFYGRGVIQPSLWESGHGHVHMFLRSTEGAIYRADSEDFAKTWSKAYRTELPNNNACIDVVRMQDGGLLLCANPVAKNWGPRTPLTIQYSPDNGTRWETLMTLEDGPGEFSYPCIRAEGNEVSLTYTYLRKTIVFMRLRYSKEEKKQKMSTHHGKTVCPQKHRLDT